MQLEEFTHQMKDGWGLATDGKVLFGSDGSSMLYQIDPQTLKGFSHVLQLVPIPFLFLILFWLFGMNNAA